MNSWASNPRGSSPFAPFSFGLSSKFFSFWIPVCGKKIDAEKETEREREKRREISLAIFKPGRSRTHTRFSFLPPRGPREEHKKTPLKREKSEGENARASSLSPTTTIFIFVPVSFPTRSSGGPLPCSRAASFLLLLLLFFLSFFCLSLSLLLLLLFFFFCRLFNRHFCHFHHHFHHHYHHHRHINIRRRRPKKREREKEDDDDDY